MQQEDFIQLVEKHTRWMQTSGTEGERLVLQDVDLRQCVLKGKDLSESQLQGCIFDGLDINSTVLVGADLTGAKLSGVKGMAANLTRANLTGVYAEGAVFAGANLAQSKCQDAQFSNANFMGATFREALLQGANFSFANLAGVDLRQAICTDTKFVRCNLQQTHFGQADCTDAVFMNAQFQGAILQGGCFTGATFHEMTLEGIDLSGVIGLSPNYRPIVEARFSSGETEAVAANSAAAPLEATPPYDEKSVSEKVESVISEEHPTPKESNPSLFFASENKKQPIEIPPSPEPRMEAMPSKEDTHAIHSDMERDKLMQGVASAVQQRTVNIHLENKLLSTARNMRILAWVWLAIFVLYALGIFMISQDIPFEELRMGELSIVGASFALLIALCLLGAKWSKKTSSLIMAYRFEKLNENTSNHPYNTAH